MSREEKWYPTILRMICLYIRYDSRYAWEECEDVPSFIDFADNDVQGLNLCLCSVILNEISISYIKVIDPVIKSIKKSKGHLNRILANFHHVSESSKKGPSN